MEDDLQSSLEVLHQGGILLYPTDTVWGIGCDATNETAIAKIFELKNKGTWVPINANEVSASITYINGKKSVTEFYYGNSFMSQSTRGIYKNSQIKSITITDNKGNKRQIQ